LFLELNIIKKPNLDYRQDSYFLVSYYFKLKKHL